MGKSRALLVWLGLIAAVSVIAGGADWLGRDRSMRTGIPYVHDGDTLSVDGERIRLLGLDAPEYDQLCTGAGGERWSCGADATTLLRDLVSGRELTCRGEGRDQYDRLLARCEVGGIDPAAELVRRGLALASGDYAAEQAAAEAAGQGMWQGSFDTPRAWRDGARPAGLVGDLVAWLTSGFTG